MANTFDAPQLQKELQRAFDTIGERISEVDAKVDVQIQIDKMILQSFLNLDLVELPSLLDTLEELRSDQANSTAKAVITGLINSFTRNRGGDETRVSH